MTLYNGGTSPPIDLSFGFEYKVSHRIRLSQLEPELFLHTSKKKKNQIQEKRCTMIDPK